LGVNKVRAKAALRPHEFGKELLNNEYEERAAFESQQRRARGIVISMTAR